MFFNIATSTYEDLGQKKHSDKRPLIAETTCLKKIGVLLKKYNFYAYFCHLTSLESLRIVKSFDKRNITECTPAHLFLDLEDEKRISKIYASGFENINPPLRSKQEKKKLWQNISLIDVVGTDHAPHTQTEKKTGISGYPQIEFLVPLIFSEVFKGNLDFKKAVYLTSQRQRQIISLDSSNINVGKYADLCIVEKKEWEIKKSDILSKAAWTPFLGFKLYANVYMTIVKGKIIYQYN